MGLDSPAADEPVRVKPVASMTVLVEVTADDDYAVPSYGPPFQIVHVLYISLKSFFFVRDWLEPSLRYFLLKRRYINFQNEWMDEWIMGLG